MYLSIHKGFKKTILLNLLFGLLSIFSFTACSKGSKEKQFDLSEKDRIWLDKFFKELLLEESGIFTLWGSKPMVSFEVCLYSPEELRLLQSEENLLEMNEKVVITNYDFPENWKKWEIFRNSLDVNRFLLFMKKDPEDPKLPIVYFINILEMALTIEKNYPLFRKSVGRDFDSLNVIYEMEEEGSEFWEIVFNDSTLMGLLYGFGLENALAFHWKYRNNHPCETALSSHLYYTFNDLPANQGEASLRTFSIPIFASFSSEDPVVKKYLFEKKSIQEMYKHQDFVELTLKRLTL